MSIFDFCQGAVLFAVERQTVCVPHGKGEQRGKRHEDNGINLHTEQVAELAEERGHRHAADIGARHLHTHDRLRVFGAETHGRLMQKPRVNGRTAEPDENKARHRRELDRHEQ